MRYVYLHGYNSGPQSTKAQFFKKKLEEIGHELIVPDLGKDFRKHTFSQKLSLAQASIPEEPTVVIGSSLGGYIAALVAANNSNVKAIVLFAPAFGCFSRIRQNGSAFSQEIIADGLQYAQYPLVTCPCLAFIADKDEVIPHDEISGFAIIRPNCSIITVVDATHQFHSHENLLWAESLSFLNNIG